MLSSAALASGSMLHRRRTNGLGVAVAVAVFERSTRLLTDESPGYAPCLALSLRSFAHLGAHHHHCSSADLRASDALGQSSRLHSNNCSIGCAFSSRVASRCWRAGTAEACSDGMVNLQQLEGSQASRQPAASAKHALSIEQRALHFPEHALALQPVGRVTSSFTIPSSAMPSHVVMPFLSSLPACE